MCIRDRLKACWRYFYYSSQEAKENGTLLLFRQMNTQLMYDNVRIYNYAYNAKRSEVNENRPINNGGSTTVEETGGGKLSLDAAYKKMCIRDRDGVYDSRDGGHQYRYIIRVGDLIGFVSRFVVISYYIRDVVLRFKTYGVYVYRRRLVKVGYTQLFQIFLIRGVGECGGHEIVIIC